MRLDGFDLKAGRAAFRDAAALPPNLPGRLADRYARAREDAKAAAVAKALAALRAASPFGGENLLNAVDLAPT